MSITNPLILLSTSSQSTREPWENMPVRNCELCTFPSFHALFFLSCIQVASAQAQSSWSILYVILEKRVLLSLHLQPILLHSLLCNKKKSSNACFYHCVIMSHHVLMWTVNTPFNADFVFYTKVTQFSGQTMYNYLWPYSQTIKAQQQIPANIWLQLSIWSHSWMHLFFIWANSIALQPTDII